MKLTYWVAPCRNDHQCYSLRGKTKKAVKAMLAAGDYAPGTFGPIFKATFEYDSAFDLMKECLGEGGAYWES